MGRVMRMLAARVAGDTGGVGVNKIERRLAELSMARHARFRLCRDELCFVGTLRWR